MADCVKCGSKAGMGKKMCVACTTKEAEERAQQEAQQRQRQRELEEQRNRQAQEAKEKRWQEFLRDRIASIEATLAQGVTPYLYEILTVDGLSYFHDSPNPNSWWNFKTQTRNVGTVTDAARLQQLGWNGWEVVGVIPITFGGSQYNNVGGNTVHAAAYGGLVVGAQLLLRLPISERFLKESQQVVIDQLAKEFPG